MVPTMPACSGSTTSVLFSSSRFWVSRNVPTRSKILELIVQNGGFVVPTERRADLKIVNPDQKNLPPGCCSYRYVEASVRNGRLEDPEKHRVAPSDQRAMGASNIPKTGTRSEYSLKEDQFLWDYLEPYEKEGAPTSGNKLYQELAKKHPAHPWQSWRSRYTRVLRGKPRPGGEKPRSDVDDGKAPRSQASAQLPLEPVHDKNTLPSSARVEPPRDSKRKRDSVDETTLSSTKRKAVEPAEPSIPTWPDSPHRSVATSPRPRAEQIHQDTLPVPHPTEAPSIPAPVKKSSPEVSTVSEALFLELPFLELEPESDSEGEDDDDLDGEESDDMPVESWVDAQVEKGVSDRDSVTKALLHSSMDTDIALQLLKTWSAGQDLPDMPGVWTPKDDECLEAGSGRDIERVAKKHGEESLKNRWEYLSISRGLTLA